jgi:hypothetical protein
MANADDAGQVAETYETIYLSNNVLFDSGDTLLPGARNVPAVLAGTTNTGPADVTLPAGISGTFYIFAVTDYANTVGEATETNNTSFRVITIK